MRLALAVIAYLCGVGALIVTAVAGYQIMVPADPGAVTTVSSALPPRSEPKRVEAIRPVNEPFQTPTPKYELSGVPISATAAYNKKKAKENYGRRSVHRNGTPKISNEAANAYGSASSYTPPPRAPRDWTIY
jgi:hypothetical protein